MQAPARVIIAEAHPIYRRGMRRAFEAQPNIEFAGESRDGWSAIQLARAAHPNVAVIDWRLPKVDGLAVLLEIRASLPEARVIFVSAETDAAVVNEALLAGAAGFLSKMIDENELCRCLHRSLVGQPVISADLQPRLADHVCENGDQGGALSKRERQILGLVANGQSARGIGETLHLSPTTVRTYMRRSYEKLGVRTQSAAIASAFRLGILE